MQVYSHSYWLATFNDQYEPSAPSRIPIVSSPVLFPNPCLQFCSAWCLLHKCLLSDCLCWISTRLSAKFSTGYLLDVCLIVHWSVCRDRTGNDGNFSSGEQEVAKFRNILGIFFFLTPCSLGNLQQCSQHRRTMSNLLYQIRQMHLWKKSSYYYVEDQP